jgi:hypothetical protein
MPKSNSSPKSTTVISLQPKGESRPKRKKDSMRVPVTFLSTPVLEQMNATSAAFFADQPWTKLPAFQACWEVSWNTTSPSGQTLSRTDVVLIHGFDMALPGLTLHSSLLAAVQYLGDQALREDGEAAPLPPHLGLLFVDAEREPAAYAMHQGPVLSPPITEVEAGLVGAHPVRASWYAMTSSAATRATTLEETVALEVAAAALVDVRELLRAHEGPDALDSDADVVAVAGSAKVAPAPLKTTLERPMGKVHVTLRPHRVLSDADIALQRLQSIREGEVDLLARAEAESDLIACFRESRVARVLEMASGRNAKNAEPWLRAILDVTYLRLGKTLVDLTAQDLAVSMLVHCAQEIEVTLEQANTMLMDGQAFFHYLMHVHSDLTHVRACHALMMDESFAEDFLAAVACAPRGKRLWSKKRLAEAHDGSDLAELRMKRESL